LAKKLKTFYPKISEKLLPKINIVCRIQWLLIHNVHIYNNLGFYVRYFRSLLRPN
jgi:hypothetical protein